jgi:hypothetical protein
MIGGNPIGQYPIAQNMQSANRYTINLSYTCSTTTSLLHHVIYLRILNYTSATVAALTKHVTYLKNLQVTVASNAILLAYKIHLLLLSCVSSTATNLQKVAHYVRTLNYNVTTTTYVQKMISFRLWYPSSATAKVTKTVTKTINYTSITIAQIARNHPLLLQATVSSIGFISKIYNQWKRRQPPEL